MSGTDLADRGEEVVRRARKWLGTPYRHQASHRGAGADCLGLIRGVWRDVYGCEPEAIPEYTPDWGETSGMERLWQAASRHLREKDRAEPWKPGELLLFRMRRRGPAKHLGILSDPHEGHLRFIHAMSGQTVVESPLSLPWRRRVVARFEFPDTE